MKRLRLALVLSGLGVLLLGVALVVYASPSAPSSYRTDARAEYVGANACLTCHTSTHSLWEKTLHPLAIEDARSDIILMVPDEGTETRLRIAQTDSKPYTPALTTPADFADSLFGLEDNPHRYIMKTESGYAVMSDLPELSALPDSLPENVSQTITVFRIRDWLNGCQDCHADLKLSFTSFTGKIYLNSLKLRLNCESCHGPGGTHVNEYAAREASTARSRAEQSVRIAVNVPVQGTQLDQTQNQVDPIREAETIRRQPVLAPT